ncbi:MAG: DndE family protein [Culicoidibacterales bacterium]
MNTRLRISKNASGKIDEFLSVTRWQTKATAIRVAVALSLQHPTNPLTEKETLPEDTIGYEFSRSTITGDQDLIYKIIITQHYGAPLDEATYFPKLFNAHIERGVNILHSELKYAGNYEKLQNYLFEKLGE